MKGGDKMEENSKKYKLPIVKIDGKEVFTTDYVFKLSRIMMKKKK